MRMARTVGAAGAAVLVTLAMAVAAPDRVTAQARGIPWLGVSTQELTGDLREGLGYQGGGVLVNRVVPESPAQRAGVRTGDVIVRFDARTIDTPEELVEAVRAARVGQSVSLAIVRDGARRTVTARLAERPAGMEQESGGRAPAPRTPRAPRAPEPPRGPTFEWDEELFEFPGGEGRLRILGRPRLGVQTQDMDADLGEALGVPDGKGVLATRVTRDSPAARAGIRAGDVIREVGGRPVEHVADLRRELRDREGRVTVTVMRRGARRTVDADLEAPRSVMRLRERLGGEVLRGNLEGQLRELRRELSELRRRLEELERR